MVEVCEYSEGVFGVMITKTNGVHTPDEIALIRKAKSLAGLEDDVWDKFESPDGHTRTKSTNLSDKENGE